MVVLRPLGGHFQCPHAVAQGRTAGQIPALQQTKQQSTAPRIATPGGIDHGLGGHGGHLHGLALLPDLAALCAQRHDQALHLVGQGAQIQPRALAEHLGLVVVYRHPAGLLDKGEQFLPIEHGQALAGVKHKGDARRMQLGRVLEHGIASIRGDDGDFCPQAGINRVQVRVVHGPGVKGGDLVVVPVGHDHGLGGVAVRHLPNAMGRNAQVLQALHILHTVLAHGGHGHGLTAQQVQAVSNIACAATKIAAQRGHQEGHIQNV